MNMSNYCNFSYNNPAYKSFSVALLNSTFMKLELHSIMNKNIKRNSEKISKFLFILKFIKVY